MFLLVMYFMFLWFVSCYTLVSSMCLLLFVLSYALSVIVAVASYI